MQKNNFVKCECSSKHECTAAHNPAADLKAALDEVRKAMDFLLSSLNYEEHEEHEEHEEEKMEEWQLDFSFFVDDGGIEDDHDDSLLHTISTLIANIIELRKENSKLKWRIRDLEAGMEAARQCGKQPETGGR